MKRLLAISLILTFFLLSPSHAWAQFHKTFQTKYTLIQYTQDEDIDDFFWRLGGQRLEFVNDPQLASHRIDRLIDRVQMILDMRPRDFQVTIHLFRGPMAKNRAAFYETKTNTIHVSVDYTSDGVVAHEIAHASINQYFDTPPPSKMQEILAQYVDKHLWSDY